MLAKYIFDRIVALTAMILLSPVILILFIIHKIAMPGGAFVFKQERIGRHGKPFMIYKIRTMYDNAERGGSVSTYDDPRITPFGRWLRETKLDTILELINVLKGEMSFVGPRPVVSDELSWYQNNKERLLSVKPGLTGWWAANGRSEVSYPERCDYELYYVDNASLLLDLKILFKTATIVFSRKGAI